MLLNYPLYVKAIKPKSIAVVMHSKILNFSEVTKGLLPPVRKSNHNP
jgi:hypothetical protein